jgi:hypothetical protein
VQTVPPGQSFVLPSTAQVLVQKPAGAVMQLWAAEHCSRVVHSAPTVTVTGWPQATTSTTLQITKALSMGCAL